MCVRFIKNKYKGGNIFCFSILTTHYLHITEEQGARSWALMESFYSLSWMLSVCIYGSLHMCLSLWGGAGAGVGCGFFFCCCCCKEGDVSPFGACLRGEEGVMDIPSLLNAPFC